MAIDLRQWVCRRLGRVELVRVMLGRWHDGLYRVASDGRALCAVGPSALAEERRLMAEQAKWLEPANMTLALWPHRYVARWVGVAWPAGPEAECRDCGGRGEEHWRVECQNCCGEGCDLCGQDGETRSWGPQAWEGDGPRARCRRCDGVGVVSAFEETAGTLALFEEEKRRALQALEPVLTPMGIVDGGLLRQVGRLPGAELGLYDRFLGTNGEFENAIPFRFAGGVGAVMPIRPSARARAELHELWMETITTK